MKIFYYTFIAFFLIKCNSLPVSEEVVHPSLDATYSKSLSIGNKFIYSFNSIAGTSLIVKEVIKDTVINNKEYAVMLREFKRTVDDIINTRIVYERADTLCLYNYYLDADYEVLIFNFSWSTSDTIPRIFNDIWCRYGRYSVTNSDSSMIFNEICQRIEIYSNRDDSINRVTFHRPFGITYDLRQQDVGNVEIITLEGAIINGTVFGKNESEIMK